MNTPEATALAESRAAIRFLFTEREKMRQALRLAQDALKHVRDKPNPAFVDSILADLQLVIDGSEVKPVGT